MSKRVGVMIAGLGGSVATTVVAGAEIIRRGMAPTTGMVTESLRIQTDASGESSLTIQEVLGLTSLQSLVFGGWDTRPEHLYEAARRARVVHRGLLDQVEEYLAGISPLPGIVCLEGAASRSGEASAFDNLHAGADAIRRDITTFKKANGVDQVVIVNLLPTKAQIPADPSLLDPEEFETSLYGPAPTVTPDMIYFYAAIKEGCPFINFTPNRVEIPALTEMALRNDIPHAGRDGKTGQTYLKTALAPAFRDRHLKVRGWYSTNILGNSDGASLEDPAARSSKIESKSGVLDSILGYPLETEDGEPTHVVDIRYYPPRGDTKEAWDSIDLEGFLGAQMQLKVNFLCKDSILAAPLVLDLIRLIDHASTHGHTGPLQHLGFFFKSPLTPDGETVVHDLFEQKSILLDYVRTHTHPVSP